MATKGSHAYADQALSLRPLQSTDAHKVALWLQDDVLTSLTFVAPHYPCEITWPNTPHAFSQYMHSLLFDHSRKTYAIELSGTHVGNVGLKNYDPYNKKSEFFIEIGEAGLRGHGIGTAALALFLEHVFEAFELMQVGLEVLEFNKSAIYLYEKLGFEHTKPTGWHYDETGKCHRVLGMRLFREKWQCHKHEIHIKDYLHPIFLIQRA